MRSRAALYNLMWDAFGEMRRSAWLRGAILDTYRAKGNTVPGAFDTPTGFEARASRGLPCSRECLSCPAFRRGGSPLQLITEPSGIEKWSQKPCAPKLSKPNQKRHRPPATHLALVASSAFFISNTWKSYRGRHPAFPNDT